MADIKFRFDNEESLKTFSERVESGDVYEGKADSYQVCGYQGDTVTLDTGKMTDAGAVGKIAEALGGKVVNDDSYNVF